MDYRLCRRCLNHNRPAARFCAACGCPLPVDQPSSPAAETRRGGTIVPWILFVTLAAVVLGPRGTHNQTLVDSPPGPRVTGLIIDFPPDYPAEFFTRYALPVE